MLNDLYYKLTEKHDSYPHDKPSGNNSDSYVDYLGIVRENIPRFETLDEIKNFLDDPGELYEGYKIVKVIPRFEH